MTQPDREHHLATKVRIVSVEIMMRTLAADGGRGPYISDVITLGELKTTIPVLDGEITHKVQDQVLDVFDTLLTIARGEVALFDSRAEVLAEEMNKLKEKFSRESKEPQAEETTNDPG